MEIILIQPDSLRSVWTRVREGLDKIPPDDWIPEDVYHCVKSGDSALYIGLDANGYCGFFVLRKMLTEFSRKPVLHCWLAHNTGDADVFSVAHEFVTKMARDMGADKLTFASPRKGWAKRFPLVTASYEVPLEGVT